MIPQEIRDYETYIVAYSGGKDSMATLTWALENLPHERLRVVYNPTGADPVENGAYMQYIESKFGIAIEVVKAGDRPLPPKRNGKPRYAWELATNLYDMIRLRGMWPCDRVRYCTTYLKQWPMTLWARAELQNPVMLMGQRKEESDRRMRLSAFSHGSDNKAVRDGLPVYRPILDWTEGEVWRVFERYDIVIHPVYNRSSRCNCSVCFQARPVEIFRYCRFDPEGAARWAALEEEIDHTWKDGQSIGNLLRQARTQLPLFEPQPRFAEVAA